MDVDKVFEEFKKNFESLPKEEKEKWLLEHGFVKNEEDEEGEKNRKTGNQNL